MKLIKNLKVLIFRFLRVFELRFYVVISGYNESC